MQLIHLIQIEDEGRKIVNSDRKNTTFAFAQREGGDRAMDFVVWIVHILPIHFIRKENRSVGKAGEILSFEKVSLTDSMIIFRI